MNFRKINILVLTLALMEISSTALLQAIETPDIEEPGIVQPDIAGDRLLVAAKMDDITEARSALAADADINYAGKYSDLHTEITDLDDAGEDEENETTNPLLEAASAGHSAMVQFLLEHHANVNWASSDGHTALMKAAANQHPEIIKLLLKNGADPNIQTNERADCYGETALMHSNDAVTSKAILDHALPTNPVNVNLRDHDGNTALTLAIISIEPEIVALLLAQGANPNEPDAENKPPLIEAITVPFSDDTTNDYSIDPAISAQIKSIIKLLLGHGANPNTVYNGETALEWATLSFKPEIVELLLAKGANP